MYEAEATLGFHIFTHRPSCKLLNCMAYLMGMSWRLKNWGKNITCTRIKTKAIIKHVIALDDISKLMKSLSNVTYSGIATEDFPTHLIL